MFVCSFVEGRTKTLKRWQKQRLLLVDTNMGQGKNIYFKSKIFALLFNRYNYNYRYRYMKFWLWLKTLFYSIIKFVCFNNIYTLLFSLNFVNNFIILGKTCIIMCNNNNIDNLVFNVLNWCQLYIEVYILTDMCIKQKMNSPKTTRQIRSPLLQATCQRTR